VKSGASKEVVSGECYTQGAIHKVLYTLTLKRSLWLVG